MGRQEVVTRQFMPNLPVYSLAGTEGVPCEPEHRQGLDLFSSHQKSPIDFPRLGLGLRNMLDSVPRQICPFFQTGKRKDFYTIFYPIKFLPFFGGVLRFAGTARRRPPISYAL